jgi:hypothetical protein
MLRRANATNLLSQALLFACIAFLVENLVYFPFLFTLP